MLSLHTTVVLLLNGETKSGLIQQAGVHSFVTSRLEQTMTRNSDWVSIIEEIGPSFAALVAKRDAADEFVEGNYDILKEHRIFSALVPKELGGGGAKYADICDVLRTLAHYCPSTALALSMHQHLVATLRWNYINGRPGEKPLRAVAANELVLVSTGAGDWLASKGIATKVDGGFSVTARKVFGSGSPAGGMLVTSVPYEDPAEGWQVIHCPVPVAAEGVSVSRDWKAMGMRATGSHTVEMKDVFVPEEAVVLRRPRGVYHPFFDVVLTVAPAIYTAPYVGTAEAAVAIANVECSKLGDDGTRPGLLGEVHNEMMIAQLAHAEMIAGVNEFDVAPDTERANRNLICKTLIANSVKRTAEKAVEAVGGSAYFRKLGLERLLRDLYAAQFHPLPERKQQLFTGRLAMGLGTPEEMGWANELRQAAE